MIWQNMLSSVSSSSGNKITFISVNFIASFIELIDFLSPISIDISDSFIILIIRFSVYFSLIGT